MPWWGTRATLFVRLLRVSLPRLPNCEPIRTVFLINCLRLLPLALSSALVSVPSHSERTEATTGVSLRSFLIVLSTLTWSAFREQNTIERDSSVEQLGWSDLTILLGSHRLPKWGRSSPTRVLPASKLIVAQRATFTLPITSVHPQGERNGERGGDLCLSRTVHLPFPEDRTDADDFSPGRC